MSAISNYIKRKGKEDRYEEKDIIEKWIDEQDRIRRKFFTDMLMQIELDKKRIEKEVTDEVIKQINKALK